jgi:hypothetical protein
MKLSKLVKQIAKLVEIPEDDIDPDLIFEALPAGTVEDDSDVDLEDDNTFDPPEIADE